MEPFQRLELEVGKWLGYPAENVVGCSSGTAALHLALEALQISSGSTVLVPDYTMIACPRAVALAGLKPTFVDCGDDLLLHPPYLDSLSRATLANTSAIMPVHIYGRRCDMARISQFASRHGLHVVEDMAEIHGVAPHHQTDAACYSFYRNKVVAGEEGGCVAFREARYAGLARQLRSLGFTAAHDYQHTPRGHNYRLSNAHASLILPSLANVAATIAARRSLEAVYEAYCPPRWRMPARQSPWVYDLRIPGLTTMAQSLVVERLKEAGIQARHGFKPMTAQAEFDRCEVVGSGTAARLASEVIYLPLTPGLPVATVRQAFDLIDPR